MTDTEAHWFKIAWWVTALALLNTAVTTGIMATDGSGPTSSLGIFLRAATGAALLSSLWCSVWATLPLARGWPSHRCRRAALMACYGFGVTALFVPAAWIATALVSMF